MNYSPERKIKVDIEPGLNPAVISQKADEQFGNDEVPVFDSGIVSASTLSEQYPHLREQVISDLLRQGETMNVIGASKAGKSWLIHGLAVAVANGIPWLGHNVNKGRVLLIDNELHPETLIDRLRKVAAKYEDPNGFTTATLDGIDILPLRGVPDKFDVEGLDQRLAMVAAGHYRLICIDALYRALPKGTSESDNAQMMQVYNQLDRIARMTDAAIVLNHHASKGDQSGKSVTDVGSGAGSISRATDTHLVIRPHAEEGLCVLDTVCRSFPPAEQKSIRFEWPLWEVTGVEPKLKQPRKQKADRQEAMDAEGREEVLNAIGTDGAFVGGIRAQTGFGQGRVNRLLKQLKGKFEVRGEMRPCDRVKEGESMFYVRT